MDKRKFITAAGLGLAALALLCSCSWRGARAGDVYVLEGNVGYQLEPHEIYSLKKGKSADYERPDPREAAEGCENFTAGGFEVKAEGCLTAPEYTVYDANLRALLWQSDTLSLPAEPGDYIVCVEVCWGSERNNVGAQYFFNLTVPRTQEDDPFEELTEESPTESPNGEGSTLESSAPSAPEAAASAAQPQSSAGETRNRAEIKEDMLTGIKEWKQKNSDTVGWLYIPETTVDSPVLQTTDNTYYLKHNENKTEDRNGALVSDYRNVLGGRDVMSKNIVIYGHSKDENPDGGVESSREYEHFTELKRYQNIDFCRENPYIMFASDGDAMVWEIFAVFHTKTDFVYNRPNASASERMDMIRQAREKSLFDFDIEVSENDNILTLSTCCRRIVPTYPNGYRFVIMARLVDKGVALTYDTAVTENPNGLSPWNVY